MTLSLKSALLPLMMHKKLPLAIDSFYSVGAVARKSYSETATPSGHSNRKRHSTCQNFTPATAGYNVELSNGSPAKRFFFPKGGCPPSPRGGAPPSPSHNLRPMAMCWFPLQGTAIGRDLPESVRPNIEGMKATRATPPDRLLLRELGPDGKTTRPNMCRMKACGLTHNWASCPLPPAPAAIP